MIHAVMSLDASGQITGCDLRGHSGWGEAGTDIVCAAVSALSISCVNSLEALCGIRLQTRGGEDGLLSFRLPAVPAQAGHDAQLLLRSLQVGLQGIAEAYPHNVKLSIRKEGTQP